jgi:hypothetical protein
MQVTFPLFFIKPHKNFLHFLEQLDFIQQTVFTSEHIGFAKPVHITEVFYGIRYRPEAFEIDIDLRQASAHRCSW